jgi:hypothetical protein
MLEIEVLRLLESLATEMKNLTETNKKLPDGDGDIKKNEKRIDSCIALQGAIIKFRKAYRI